MAPLSISGKSAFAGQVFSDEKKADKQKDWPKGREKGDLDVTDFKERRRGGEAQGDGWGCPEVMWKRWEVCSTKKIGTIRRRES